jgi:fumarate reductase subunit C
LLAYAPYNLQRRLPDGIWVCVGLLAISGLQILKQRTKTIPNLFIGFSLMPSIVVLSMGIFAVLHPAVPVFQPADKIRIIKYIGQNLKQNEIVLSSYSNGNVLPAWAQVRVLSGLGPESADMPYYNELIKSFYSTGMTEEKRVGFIEKNNISYVFMGVEEKKMGDWNPNLSKNYQKVCEFGEYQLFKYISPK